MVNNLVGVRWDQSLSEVERSQTGRASSGMLVEGLEGGSDSQRVNCRRKPYIGSTQPGEVGVATRRRVLTDHLIEDNIGVGRRRRVESLAGLGVGPFSTEVFAPLVAEGCFNLRRLSPRLLTGSVTRNVLPQGSPLAIEPPLQPVPREGKPLVLVLLARARGSTQDALGEHLLFSPATDIIVE